MESKLEVLVKSATELRNKPSQKLSQFVSIRLRGKKIKFVYRSVTAAIVLIIAITPMRGFYVTAIDNLI